MRRLFRFPVLWRWLTALCLAAPLAISASTLTDQLAQLLAAASPSATPLAAGDAIRNPDALRTFYRSRGFQPLWTDSTANRRRTANLLGAIHDGAGHGLVPGRYHLAGIERALADGPAAEAELLLSDAFLLQAQHRADGVLNPRLVAPEWYAFQPSTEVLSHLEAVARGADPRQELNRLWPEEPEYWRLLDARPALLAAAAAAPQVTIPTGPILRLGMTDPRVPMLRQRLSLPEKQDRAYDADLVAAVSAYQRATGLETDGRVGPRTLGELNKTPQERLQQIAANLERWRWLPPALPATRIMVNVAAFELAAINGRQPVLKMPVIVGKPLRPTPALQQNLRYLVFNPFWEIPETIAVEDKLPELRRNPSRLAEQGVEAARAGSDTMVPVDQIDWRAVPTEPFPYRLRQRPGPLNPLGRLKFMLPNEQAIYLHDTPDTALFNRCERSFSSGCVRVSNAVELATWVLQFQTDPWQQERIEKAITSGTTSTVDLDSPIPVFIVYLTSDVDEDGTLRFYRDLYERDAPIISALYETAF